MGAGGGGRGSGQERGSGGSYWSAVGPEVVTASVWVEVQQDGWSHTALVWRLELEL